MFADAYRRRGLSCFMCAYAPTLSLFMFLSYEVLLYLQKYNFSFIQKVCIRNGYFSPLRLISVVMKSAFFYFKLLFRIKVSQNGFNFNQIKNIILAILEILVWHFTVERGTEIYLRGYFTLIFTDIVLYYAIVVVVVTVT